MENGPERNGWSVVFFQQKETSMADTTTAPGVIQEAVSRVGGPPPRHSVPVRVTHWITGLCFLALLVTGVEILISHPRFYWGEAGNVQMKPLFTLPIPASRGSVPTGYSFVLKDQNSWSRSLHFQAGWLLVFAGLWYGLHGLKSGHFRRELLPASGDLTQEQISAALRDKSRWDYNVVQRITYLAVILVMFPLMIWTGLAMAPGFVAGYPWVAAAFGGQQSARTIHFAVTALLLTFAVCHVAMVYRAGFWRRTRAMITGSEPGREF